MGGKRGIVLRIKVGIFDGGGGRDAVAMFQDENTKTLYVGGIVRGTRA